MGLSYNKLTEDRLVNSTLGLGGLRIVDPGRNYVLLICTLNERSSELRIVSKFIWTKNESPLLSTNFPNLTV